MPPPTYCIVGGVLMEKIIELYEKYKNYVLGGIIALILLGLEALMFWYFSNDINILRQDLKKNSVVKEVSKDVSPKKFTVDIKGEVKNPGVYILEEGKINIGGFELNITYHDENIEIEFPQINSVYTHMLGHDCHSIVAGENHANLIIGTLKGCIEKGYNLILSSHYTPETLKDVDTKIAYLENIKKIAKRSKNINEFKEEAKKEYPNYSGLNYLDMTASYFFPQN